MSQRVVSSTVVAVLSLITTVRPRLVDEVLRRDAGLVLAVSNTPRRCMKMPGLCSCGESCPDRVNALAKRFVRA